MKSKLFLLATLCVSVCCADPSFDSSFDELMEFTPKAIDHIDRLPFEIGRRSWAFLDRVKKDYELKKEWQFSPGELPLVPQTIHVIWLGERCFPRLSWKRVESWRKHNPNFTVKFWSDRPRDIPVDGVELTLVTPSALPHLFRRYQETPSWVEKADILRLEILEQEGGIYVDHDLLCNAPFDPLCKAYDLFCSLEAPHFVLYQNAFTVSNACIGSAPHHPIIQKAIELLDKNWDPITDFHRNSPTALEEFSVIRGRDEDPLFRTFSPFTLSIIELFDQCERAVLFPSLYFGMGFEREGPGLYAKHQWAGSWISTDTLRKMEKKITSELRRSNKKQLQLFAINALILIALASIFWTLKKNRKAH